MTDDFKKAYNYCIFLLSKRDYSRYKIRMKLKERKHTPEVIEETIEVLVEQNYLREEEYKRQRIKQLIYKGYANNYIIQKMAQEKLQVEVDEIEILREQNDASTESQIQYLIEKKLRGVELPEDYESKMKLKNKVTRFLISKGYQFAEINNKISEII